MNKTMGSFPHNLGVGRDLALPYDNQDLDQQNKLVKPLPSISDFDLPGIKLDLFKKYDPNIVSIADVENKRKYGHQYLQETFKSLSGKNLIDEGELKTKRFTMRIPGLGLKRCH